MYRKPEDRRRGPEVRRLKEHVRRLELWLIGISLLATAVILASNLPNIL